MVKRPSDLFNPPSPEPSPAVVPQQSKTATSSLPTVIVVALFAVLLWGVWQRQDGGGDREQDRQEQQDDKKQDDEQDDNKQTLAVKPGVLIIVRERQDPPMAEEQAVLRIADFAAKQTFPDSGKLEFRDVDEEDNTPAVQVIIAHAKRQNVDPPFVVHKSTDNVLGTVIKLPAATAPESELMEVFK